MSKILLFILISASVDLSSSVNNGKENWESGFPVRDSEIESLLKNLEKHINAKELASQESTAAAHKRVQGSDSKQNKKWHSNGQEDRSEFKFVHPNSRDRAYVHDKAPRNSMNPETSNRAADIYSNPHVQTYKLQEQDQILNQMRKELDDLRNERTILAELPAYRNQLTNSEKQQRYYSSLVRLQNLYHLYNERYLSDASLLRSSSSDGQREPSYGELLPKEVSYLNSEKLRHLEESRILADRIAESAMHLATNKFTADKLAKRGSDGAYYFDPNQDYESQMLMSTATNEADSISAQLAERGKNGSPGDPNYERQVLGLAYDLVNAMTIGATSGKEGNQRLMNQAKDERINEYLRSTLPEGADSPKLKLSNSGFDYVNHPDDELVGAAKSDKEDIVARTYFKKERSKSTKNVGKIYHLFGRPQQRSSGVVWQDVNKIYNFNDYENDKFLNLSMNCRGKAGADRDPDCDRLKLELFNPSGTEPVPLGYIKDYLNHGRDLALDMHDRGQALHREIQEVRPEPNSPSMLQYINDQVTEATIQINRESQNVLFGLKVLEEKMINDYNMTPKSFFEFLQHHNIHVTGSQICRARLNRCNSLSKYRSIDGSCNNLRNPSWGKSKTALARILPARYSDGISALARGKSRKPLPNARVLSSELFDRRSSADSSLTLALVHWGQLVDHDFARVVSDQTVHGGIECCHRNGRGPVPKSMQHHSCMPIDIDSYDRFYSKYNQTCMNYVRSMTVAKEDCSLDSADQLNEVSSYLDLSPIYGSDQVMSDVLREFQAGRLRAELRDKRVMTPASQGTRFCDARTSQDVCYLTGDVRSNENPGLSVLHTLLVREHNRVAYELATLNPHWSDEQLFQESRRIVIAEYQHITYQHWLPLVLGKSYVKSHGILGQENEELSSQDYNVKINPSVINSFTSAAFRFLHSSVQGKIKLISANGTTSKLRLSDYYYRPHIVEKDFNFESIFRGMVGCPMQKPDTNFDEEVAEYHYRSSFEFGADLAAIDIHSGRDHGLPGYNDYRELCHLGRAEDFHDLINEISLNNLEKLQLFYEDVDDVDLLVGALMESKAPGSLLGPTMRCLIGEQFYRAKAGDRFFYSHDSFKHSFSAQQFNEIKKASLATLMCDSSDAFAEIQDNPFRLGSYQNSKRPCYELPRMNLRYWKEEQPSY